MVNVSPARNRTSPKANMAESKKKRHPRNRKTQPRKSRPLPILVLSLTLNMIMFCQLLLCLSRFLLLILGLRKRLTRAEVFPLIPEEAVGRLTQLWFLFSSLELVLLERHNREHTCLTYLQWLEPWETFFVRRYHSRDSWDKGRRKFFDSPLELEIEKRMETEFRVLLFRPCCTRSTNSVTVKTDDGDRML